MRKIPNSAGSDGESSEQNQDGYVDSAFGWETTDSVTQKPRLNKDVWNYINSKFLLKDLFKQSGLHFEEIYSPSGWTHSRCCPFPDHKDDTPSFKFNPEENRFWCFGCKRGGKAIQFLAYYKKISKTSAAETLLRQIGNIEDICLEIENTKQDETDSILLEFSKTVREFIHNNKSYAAIEFVEKTLWGLDLYLYKHAPRSTLNEANLIARINILKGKLIEYVQQNTNRR